MKKRSLLSLLSLPLCLCSDGEISAVQSTSMNRQQTQAKPARVSLDSARPESDNGWYLFADALYWHADIGSTDWAVKINPAQFVNRDNMHSLNFKWAWGFRAGIGANMSHGMWDTNLYYTWFHTSNSNSAADPHPFVDVILLESAVVQNAHIRWTLHFSMFDWELGGWYYLNDVLAIRPHVGLKGGWIKQNVKVACSDTIASATFPAGGTCSGRFRNDFWGVGPSLGINTLWVLGSAGERNQHRFSLFGDGGGALMYGHFRVKYKALFAPTGFPVAGDILKGLDRNLAVAMLQGMFGFAWDTDFNQNRNHFTFRLGYELQYWFRQNQLVKEGSTLVDGGISRLSDDLALQGITADFRFDF